MGYVTDFKPVGIPANPNFKCPKCAKRENIEFAEWEDSECHEDIHYKCLDCKHSWWIEGPDY